MDVKTPLIMKMITLAIILLCLIPQSKAANRDSLIEISGYYIIRFDKKEINDSFSQKINKMKDSSFLINIDLRSTSFFIPLQIGDNFIMDEKSVYKSIDSMTNLNRDTIFFIPVTKYFEKYIENTFNKKVDLSKEICLLQEVNRSLPYYAKDDESDFLYKFVHLKGQALKTSLPNTVENRFKIDLSIDSVNRESNEIDIYFLVDIADYSHCMDIFGLYKWYPYINDQ